MSKKSSNRGASTGARSAKGKQAAATSKKGATSSAVGLSTSAKVVIVIFAVLMVVSLMMPTLSTAFSRNQQAEQSSSQDSSSDSNSDNSSDSSDSSASDTSSATGAAAVDAKYQDTVSELESKLSSDNTNLATLLNLGRNYMRWGASVLSVSSSDSDTTHGNELLEKAIGYYQQYLGLKDSDAVRVDIALCKLYEGETSEAQSDLETLTQNSPTYAPAWANLGMVQEYAGDKDAAKTSYQTAIDNDPNDEYGAKSYATQRLSALESSSSATSSTTSTGTSATSSSSGETGAKGLTDTLSNLSGTGL
jgi:tetratricopeptide (TPR) repeat protein